MRILKSIERHGKRLLVNLVGFAAKSGRNAPDFEGCRNNIRKILIFRLEQKVGNVVMTTFFPRALKDVFPGVSVELLVHESTKPIWNNNPFVDKIHVFSHKKHLTNPVLLLKLLFGLRKSRFDVVIDCSTPGGFSVSNGLLTWFTGAPFKVGFQRGESDKFLNMTVPPDHSKHYVDIMHDLLILLGGKGKYSPELFLTGDEHEHARRKFSASGVDFSKEYVLFWLGARSNKQWNTGNFLKLAGKLRESGNIQAFYLCGPEEKDILADLGESERLIFVDDLRELAALIDLSEMFVSGDAGPLHLAAALNVKTAGVFLQENYTVFGYDDGINHRVINLSADKDNVNKVFQVCIEMLKNAVSQKS